MPEELWTEVCNIAQDVLTKIIHKKKKWRRQSGCLEEALQIAGKEEKWKAKEKGQDVSNWKRSSKEEQGEKKILSEQCKEIEENKRVGKTSDLFKKSGGTKGIFHAKMVTINDRNSKDLTEAEEINKRWQEYTELYQKKLLMTK